MNRRPERPASTPERAVPAERADATETIRAVASALSKAGGELLERSAKLREAAGLVRFAPASIRRVGAIRAGPTTWVWCEPAPRASTAASVQLVLDLPSGRYLCDVLDVDGSRWCSRESAAGGPLVIGLPVLAGDAVLRIVRLASSRAGPAGRPSTTEVVSAADRQSKGDSRRRRPGSRRAASRRAYR